MKGGGYLSLLKGFWEGAKHFLSFFALAPELNTYFKETATCRLGQKPRTRKYRDFLSIE